jgi:hypothetical protein
MAASMVNRRLDVAQAHGSEGLGDTLSFRRS